MTPVARYFSDLAERFGRGWNRFWFEPSDPLTLSVLRILVGLMALWYHFSYTFDLIEWFGPAGLASVEATRQVVPGYHPSHMFLTNAPTALWAVHAAGFAVLLALVVGLLTRVSAVLSLLLVLSYAHRSVMISGQFEPVLTMMLLYLCIGPAGAYLSLDSLLRRRSAAASAPPVEAAANSADEPHACLKSSWATVSVRLMQVHLAAFYALAGLTMLRGDAWWGGEAIWWLAADPQTRTLDLTWLSSRSGPEGPGFLLNAWTGAVVALELLFPILIWNRLARPILLTAAAAMWISLALVTGQVSYCVMMVVGSVAFVSPEALCHLGDRFARKPATEAGG